MTIDNTSAIDHNAIAAKLDRVYALATDLDRDLAAAGLRSWQPPRTHLLAAHAELHHLRHALDALAGGPGQATPYVYREPVAAPLPPADFLGPHYGHSYTGDDDRRASLVNGHALGASTATPVTPAPSADLAARDHAHEAEALTSSPRASEPV